MPLKCQSVALARSGDTLPQSVCGDLVIATQQPLLIIPGHVTADLNHLVPGAYQADGGVGWGGRLKGASKTLVTKGDRAITSVLLCPQTPASTPSTACIM